MSFLGLEFAVNLTSVVGILNLYGLLLEPFTPVPVQFLKSYPLPGVAVIVIDCPTLYVFDPSTFAIPLPASNVNWYFLLFIVTCTGVSCGPTTLYDVILPASYVSSCALLQLTVSP